MKKGSNDVCGASDFFNNNFLPWFFFGLTVNSSLFVCLLVFLNDLKAIGIADRLKEL